MTNSIWRKFFECFFIHFNKSTDRIQKGHLIQKYAKYYDAQLNNQFDGILTWLGNGKPLKAFDEGIINITCSSFIKNSKPQNVLEFTNDGIIFNSPNIPNSWLCVDFKDYKVNLFNYSIKSNGFGGSGHFHPQNWQIEGSNDDANWELLDSHYNDRSLDNRSVVKTFEVNNRNKYYRYIRIIQKGLNTRYNDALVFAAIEFFGLMEHN